jgi:hypothetical protein
MCTLIGDGTAMPVGWVFPGRQAFSHAISSLCGASCKRPESDRCHFQLSKGMAAPNPPAPLGGKPTRPPSLCSIILSWLICFIVLNVVANDFSGKTSNTIPVKRLLVMVGSPLIYLTAALYIFCALLYFIALSRMLLSTAGPRFMILGIITTTVLGLRSLESRSRWRGSLDLACTFLGQCFSFSEPRTESTASGSRVPAAEPRLGGPWRRCFPPRPPSPVQRR